jgi:CubicO group peptidase (beta-lactamase class C family)
MGGFTTEGLAAWEAGLRRHVEAGDIPGIVALVARGDDVRAAAIGAMDFDGAPMRRDAIFRIASLTKPISAAVTMMLVEDGALALEAPVAEWLPEFAAPRVLTALEAPLDSTVPAERPIIVEDLLTMRMGTGAIMTPGEFPLVAAMAEAGLAPGAHLPEYPSMDAYAAALGALPLARQPGAAWLYDTPMQLLGVLLERASGQPLEALMRARLFQPLGMDDTGFSVPEAELDRLPAAWWRNWSTGAVERFDAAGPASRFARPPGFASAAGGLVSTADDYLAFARMMLNGGHLGGRRLLSEASVRAMTADHITAEQKARSPFAPGFWETRGWGYGLSVVHSPREGDPRGFGWDGGYGTSGYWDPASGVIGILMTQRLLESPTAPPVFVDFWRGAFAAAAG